MLLMSQAFHALKELAACQDFEFDAHPKYNHLQFEFYAPRRDIHMPERVVAE